MTSTIFNWSMIFVLLSVQVVLAVFPELSNLTESEDKIIAVIFFCTTIILMSNDIKKVK